MLFCGFIVIFTMLKGALMLLVDDERLQGCLLYGNMKRTKHYTYSVCVRLWIETSCFCLRQAGCPRT